MSIIQRRVHMGAKGQAALPLLASGGQIAHSMTRFSMDQVQELLAMPISRLGLPPRIANSLGKTGVFSVGDIVDWPERQFCTIRGFGPASLHALRNALVSAAINWDAHASNPAVTTLRATSNSVVADLPDSFPLGVY